MASNKSPDNGSRLICPSRRQATFGSGAYSLSISVFRIPETALRPAIDISQIEAGKPFIFTAEVAVRPEVTLGEYKGVEVPASKVEVTDEEVDAELGREQEKNSRYITVEDRGAESGDRVTLDFDGSVDGVPFEGGKGSDYPLVLGSNSFIPGFEDQLVGAKAGEHVEVNVTFPEEYQ